MVQKYLKKIHLLDIYIFAISALGAYFLIHAAVTVDYTAHWKDLLTLVVLSGATAFLQVALPFSKASISVSYAIVFTSILLLPPSGTVLVAFVSALSGYLRSPTKQFRFSVLTFNIGNLILSAVAACNLLSLFTNVKWFWRGWQALPLLTATSVYFLVSTFSIGLAISLKESKNVKETWKQTFFWTAPSFYVGASIAWALTVFYQQFGIAVVLLAIPPLYLTYYTHKMYMGRLRENNDHLKHLADLHLRTIEALALAIDAKDETTHLHLQRVRIFASGIAKALSLPEPEVQAIRAGALLHDVGKLAVPEYILNKPGKLTPQEFNRMKIHPIVGAEILSAVNFPYPVVPVVLCHHEKYDGTGYPNGLKGEEIPITARILSVVDCFDALASDRPYRKALKPEDAMQYIGDQKSKAFDPAIVELFQELYPQLEAEAWAAAQEAQRISSNQPTLSFHFNPVAEAQAKPAAGFSEPVKINHLKNIAAANQEVYSLYELVQSVGTSLSLVETLSLIAAKIRKVIPCDSCVTYLRQENRLVPQYIDGKEKETFSGLSIPLGEGISGWVAENKRPLINANPAVEFGYLGNAARFTLMRSGLSIPLLVKEEVLGVITLYDELPNKFVGDNLRVLELISAKAALAIKNAMTFERTYENSLTDALTGLPNSRHMFLKLDEEIARARRNGTTLAILAMDLDFFKEINDSFGHTVGDKVLRQIAKQLRSTLRDYDFVARLGGDEFMAVLPGLSDEDVQKKMQQIQSEVENLQSEKRFGRSIRTSVSIGAATFPRDGKDADTLLSVADVRMYDNKFEQKKRRQEIDFSLASMDKENHFPIQ
ncbi:MAG: diguanylate cyclase [Acidobacteriia bacterium]|nr:diguanylate cyclase [Terriglobia bacterium]